MRLFLTVNLIFLIVLFSSCVGGGPQLFFDRTQNVPAEGPLPPITENNSFSAQGGGFYGSDRFAGYGINTFVYGGEASSDLYRLVRPELSLGQSVLSPASSDEEGRKP